MNYIPNLHKLSLPHRLHSRLSHDVALVLNCVIRMENGVLMTMIQLSLVLVYTCVLLIKMCNASAEACEMFGFGATAKGERKPCRTHSSAYFDDR